METEFVTEAFRTEYLYSFWWVLLPVVAGALLFVWGGAYVKDNKLSDRLMTTGAVMAVFGALVVGISNGFAQDLLDEDMFRSDISEQLQIQIVDPPSFYNAEDWHVGKGPNGEFIEFALLKDGDSDKKFLVVYK